MSKTPKVIAIILYISGIVLVVAGAFTWYTVSDQLAAEKITVSDDASCQAGQSVNGPLEAYCQAEIINHHALEATGGKTYAELDRDDPTRAVVMDASFLRASLFTSVVAFGVSALVIGLGVILVLPGLAFNRLAKAAAVPVVAEREPAYRD